MYHNIHFYSSVLSNVRFPNLAKSSLKFHKSDIHKSTFFVKVTYVLYEFYFSLLTVFAIHLSTLIFYFSHSKSDEYIIHNHA